ncbi:MAG: VCBS repeat-containing protein, partial [Balneolaceae bacterium]|nr:VCBS repeat-containing protein [Balneolaceae bacterium]
MVDINSDGYLDIYVSVGPFGNSSLRGQANLLFMNNGDNTFIESAADYNVQGRGYTTHSAFFDYDKDGDLDLFLLNNSPVDFARNEMARKPSILLDQRTSSYDELYRNNGDGSFSRVSDTAGIVRKTGFGLGLAISDINRDGWPDIYISNDILPDDVLYINNRDGTFSDKSKSYFKHISFAGMGVDVADFNNDLWPDVIQADMMPAEDIQRKRISGANNYEHATGMYQKGYHHQYNLNTLQLSNGVDKEENVIFSEIARLSGVAYTNWSWSALFGDYDNDGFKDIMITNGYPKAVNDFDYIQNLNSAREFGSRDVIREKERKLLEELYSYKISNYIYKNNGDLTFSDKSSEWAIDEPGYSYGMSQADLDSDGDLDFVINNMDGPAAIYENRADTLGTNHYLSVTFEGSDQNPSGIGAQIVIRHDGNRQYQYYSPYRGFASTMGEGLIFGLGPSPQVDSLEVYWPEGRYQLLTGIRADCEITLSYGQAEDTLEYPFSFDPGETLFRDITEPSGIDFRHRENEFNDYTKQPLLPYQLSKLGPALAAGDANGDGLADIFVGGATGQPAALFFQQEDGSFKRAATTEPWAEDARFEDLGALFIDADNDGDEDLFVASGGYEFSPASELLQDRLYINTGEGQFIRDRSALPMMLTSSSAVKPADYDGDGDLDLFVGGRLVPGMYPVPAKSYLLRNDGNSFTDITSEWAPQLVEPGMITDATWSDFNGDERPDLVTTGIWQPVRFYRNEAGKLLEVTRELGLPGMRGWWYSIEQGDFDSDGDPDFVAGNLGLNYSYPAGDDEAIELYADNFDSNQSMDLMFAVDRDGDHIPYYGRARFEQGIPEIRYLFKTYREYAESEVSDIIGGGGMRDALHYRADTFASV